MTKKNFISLLLVFTTSVIHGSAALFSAITSNNIEAIQDLIAKNAHKQRSAYYNCTPLQCAVLENKPEIVKILTDAGVKPEKSELSYGQTSPLIDAINRNNLEIVKILIDAGADVNDLYVYNTRTVTHPLENDDVMTYEETALDLAIKKNNPEIIKLLKDKGAKKFSRCSIM